MFKGSLMQQLLQRRLSKEHTRRASAQQRYRLVISRRTISAKLRHSDGRATNNASVEDAVGTLFLIVVAYRYQSDTSNWFGSRFISIWPIRSVALQRRP